MVPECSLPSSQEVAAVSILNNTNSAINCKYLTERIFYLTYPVEFHNSMSSSTVIAHLIHSENGNFSVAGRFRLTGVLEVKLKILGIVKVFRQRQYSLLSKFRFKTVFTALCIFLLCSCFDFGSEFECVCVMVPTVCIIE